MQKILGYFFVGTGIIATILGIVQSNKEAATDTDKIVGATKGGTGVIMMGIGSILILD